MSQFEKTQVQSLIARAWSDIPIPISLLQRIRNDLGGRGQQKNLNLFVPYLFPSVRVYRQLRIGDGAIYSGGPVHWWLAGDEHGHTMWLAHPE